MTRARLGRYTLWQARDYIFDRGVPTMIVGLLLGYLTAAAELRRADKFIATMPERMIAKYGSIQAAHVALLPDVNTGFVRGFLGAFVYIGMLLAMNGIVATDRNKGYYRFLLAKPLSPARYYGQAFVINSAGFLVVALLLGLLYGALVTPLLGATALLVLMGMFLLYAGIIFLLSASLRGDWLVLLLLTASATFLWDRFGDSHSLLAGLLYLLPPLSRTNEIYEALATGKPINWALLQWFAAYGAACFAAGLVVLRHRRMAVV